MIRKTIGFIPAAFVIFLIFALAALDTQISSPYIVHVIVNTPWYAWLWVLISITSGILLCIKKALPCGLIVGVIPWIIILIQMLIDHTNSLLNLPVGFITAYIVYAISYFVYHRELNKKS
ncbi:MAG: hypothetical protein E7672_01045 [Ruminococcaceae bacterium]|nr:hypothetical protein [Oscillospiraceae bacterium]